MLVRQESVFDASWLSLTALDDAVWIEDDDHRFAFTVDARGLEQVRALIAKLREVEAAIEARLHAPEAVTP